MGKLINLDDFGTKLRTELYLPPGQVLQYQIPGRFGVENLSTTMEREYHFISYVQREELDGIDPRFWIDLRKLVERNMEGDVIYWYHSMDYKWCWNRDSAKSEYDRKYNTVNHGYWHFCFEFDEDQMIFELTHGDKTSEVKEEITGMPKAPKGEYQYGGW